MSDSHRDIGSGLLSAVRNLDIDQVKYLVSKEANINTKDSDRRTPLHWAATYIEENKGVFKFLIGQKADINAKDKDLGSVDKKLRERRKKEVV